MRTCLLLLSCVWWLAACVETDLGPAPDPDPDPQPVPPIKPNPEPGAQPEPVVGGQPEPQPEVQPEPVPDPFPPQPGPPEPDGPQPESLEPESPEPQPPEPPEPDAPQPEAPEPQPMPEPAPQPPMTECMVATDCADNAQCFGLRCLPANEVCYCAARTGPDSATLVPDEECSKWGLPEFFNQDVPWEGSDQTYFELRNSIVPLCEAPGMSATGVACTAHTECQQALCIDDGSEMEFCSRRCMSDDDCAGLRCGQNPLGLRLCTR